MKTAFSRIDRVTQVRRRLTAWVKRHCPGVMLMAAAAPGLLLTVSLNAQTQQPEGPRRYDVGVTYAGEDSVRVGTDQRFWAQGGSVEVGASVWRQLGLVAGVTGGHARSIGRSGVPLSLVTATVGARYRWRIQKTFSPYAEGMVGFAAGFNSRFPTIESAQTSAHSAAFQIGGGVDYRIKRWLAIRVVDADWIRTGLPNASGNSQNLIRVGAGVVARFEPISIERAGGCGNFISQRART